ncbi:MAG: porin [Abditibacteriaceae bacterium]
MNLRIKKSTLGVALSALLLSAPAIAQADQAADVSALQQQILQMQKQLDALEANQKATDNTLQKTVDSNKKGVHSKFDVDVSGLFQVQALAPLSGDGSQGNNTFRLRRGELKLTTNITDRVSGLVLFDVAKDKIDSTNRADAMLQEITLSYLLNKNGSNKNYIDVGQTKLPLGYESLVSSSSLPFLERSMIFTQGKYGDVRDTGAQLRGNAGKLEYRVGVFNSLGDRQNNTASRGSKAYAGRLLWKASDGLQLGGSFGKGNDSGNIVNLFANYTKSTFWVWGEYAKGSNDSGTTIVDGNGFNVSAGYQFTPKLEAVVRYDKFNDTNKGDATETTLGLSYYLKSNNAKIQLNLVKHDGPLGSGGGYQNDWTELRSGFQVAF